MSFRVGDTVGAYQIVSILGTGGVGRVFKVRHNVTGRVEAMKVLWKHHAASREDVERFRREIRLQASLHHPNIAAVHNAFWENDSLVMVMELVRGDSLDNLHVKGLVPLRIGLDYICQALSALQYAHEKGITHRDINPSNMLITPEGTLKLTDFGLALIQEDFRLTQTGIVMGSAYYMSPEQVKSKGRIDHRADIYSIGALLYELTTSRKVFEGKKPFELMQAHLEQKPVPPIEVNPSLPQSLNAAILKAMAKERDERFQSAEEFRLTLEKIAEDNAPPVLRENPEDFERAQQPASGHKKGLDEGRVLSSVDRLLRSTTLQVAAGLVAAFLVIYLVALVMRQPPQGREVATQAVSEDRTGILEPMAQQSQFSGPPERMLAADPEFGPAAGQAEAADGASAADPRGSRLPEDSMTSSTGRKPSIEERKVRLPNSDILMDTGQPRSVESVVEVHSRNSKPSPLSKRQPEFGLSPVTQSEEETDNRPAIEVSGKHLLLRSLSMSDAVQVLALSSDGRWAAAGMGDHSVRVWDAATGEVRAAFRGHNGRVTSIAFSQDGEKLVTASWDGTAKVWDLAKSIEVATYGHRDSITAAAFSPDGEWLATGCADRSVKIWSLREQGRFYAYRSHLRSPQALAFSPTSPLLASVSTSGDIRIWDLAREGDLGELKGPEIGADAVAFSPDGRILAVAGSNEMRLFDFRSRRQLQAVPIPGWLHAMSSTRNGGFLVLSALSHPSHTAKLWDATTRETLSTLHHDQTIRSVALSGGAQRLATAADGGRIAIWQTRR